MKKIIIVIGLAIIALPNIQAQDTLYINQKVGGLLKVAISNIDSLTFYKPTIAGVVSQNTVVDIDGNIYNTVTIGGQVWMRENLNVSKLKDGISIPLVTTSNAWAALTTPGYCFYNFSVTGGVYGALYNWYTVNTGKLCPTGWHIPSDLEWTNLATFLGGANVAGGKLKATSNTYWLSPNFGATNETGFTALGGGFLSYNGINNPQFVPSFGTIGVWYSSTEVSATLSSSRDIVNQGNMLENNTSSKQDGCSVRCVRD